MTTKSANSYPRVLFFTVNLSMRKSISSQFLPFFHSNYKVTTLADASGIYHLMVEPFIHGNHFIMQMGNGCRTEKEFWTIIKKHDALDKCFYFAENSSFLSCQMFWLGVQLYFTYSHPYHLQTAHPILRCLKISITNPTRQFIGGFR